MLKKYNNQNSRATYIRLQTSLNIRISFAA